MAKYINPYTDFGFKKLFGEEVNKDLLIDFLNQLLPAKHQIASLDFHNPEKMPDTEDERKAFFDIHCIATSGERFIVEMQKAKVKYFKDRALYYTTFPIRDQAKLGRWNFYLDPIYFIAILDFLYEDESKAVFRRDVHLKDQHNQSFSDKLHFTFLQMPAFKKTEQELITHFDKWAYFLKNLESFENIPQILNEPVFETAFHVAEMANFSPEQQFEYEKSRMGYIGIREAVSTAEEDGLERGLQQGLEKGLEQGLQKGLEQGLQKGLEQGLQKGLEQGLQKGLEEGSEQTKITIAKQMKALGENIEKIKIYTGLTESEINAL